MKKLIIIATLALAAAQALPAASLPNQPEVRTVIVDYDPPQPRVTNWSTFVRYLRWLKLRRNP